MFGFNVDVSVLGANIPGKSAFKGLASGYRIFIFSCHRHPIFNAGLLPLTLLPLLALTLLIASFYISPVPVEFEWCLH